MSRRVVVSGGCGFVGSRLVARLVEEGCEVLALDDLSLGTPENLGAVAESVAIAECDVRDGEAVAEIVAAFSPEVVFHLAAIHFIPACDRDPKRCIDVNVGGTQSVLDACAAAEVASVVLASTAAVYAPSLEAHRVDSAIGPTDIYGLTKLWSEQLGALFHAGTGVPLRVARLFNVYGPGETNPHLIPAIIRQTEQGSELSLGNLSTRRDYVFVDDVASGLIAMSRLPARQGSFTGNLGHERALDGNEIVGALGSLLDRELTVSTDPARMRASDRPVLLSDCGESHTALSWQPQWTLEDGLKAALERPTAAGVEVS